MQSTNNQHLRSWHHGLGPVALLSLLALVSICLSSLAFRPTIKALTSPSGSETVAFTNDLDDKGEQLRREATVKGRPIFNEFGLAVPPSGNFSATWTGNKRVDAQPYVRLWMANGSVADNRVIFTTGGKSETYRISASVAGALVRANRLPTTDTSFSVTISSSLNARAQQPVFVLDRVIIGSGVFNEGFLEPGAWAMFVFGLLPLLGYAALARLAGVRASVAGAVVASVLSAGILLVPGAAPIIAWSILCLSLITGLFLQWCPGDDAGLRNVGTALAAFALVLLSLPIRWQWLVPMAAAPIAPDTIQYLHLAEEMSHPYDTGVREPLFIWLLKLWSWITATGPLAARVMTVLLSVLEGALLYLLARQFLPLAFTFPVMILYAINPLLSSSSTMALREELLPALWLGFLWACIGASRSKHKWPWWAATIAFASGMVLTRINSLGLVVPIAVLFAWREHWGWKPLAAGAAVLTVALVPHFVNSQRKFGDPFMSSNFVPKFYRNLEFAGKPGFVTREEFNRDNYAGPPITMGDYLFKLHSIPEVTSATIAGLWEQTAGKSVRKSLLRLDPRPRLDDQLNPVIAEPPVLWVEVVVYLLYLVGIIACFRLRFGWYLPLSMLLFMLPLAFFAGKGLLVPRLLMNPVPFMLLLAGISLYVIWAELRRRVFSPGQKESAATRKPLYGRKRQK